jgi:hypothetical protein
MRIINAKKTFRAAWHDRVYSATLDEMLSRFANAAHAPAAIAHRRKKLISCREGQDTSRRLKAMKKIVTALVFAAFAAAPAFAATHHKKADEANSAYAAATDPDVVIVNGKVVGADPDPNVRLSLRRDPQLQAN